MEVELSLGRVVETMLDLRTYRMGLIYRQMNCSSSVLMPEKEGNIF